MNPYKRFLKRMEQIELAYSLPVESLLYGRGYCTRCNKSYHAFGPILCPDCLLAPYVQIPKLFHHPDGYYCSFDLLPAPEPQLRTIPGRPVL